MIFNSLWFEICGLRMALEGPDAEAVLIVDIGLADLNAEILKTVLMSFIAVMRAQILVINNGIGDEAVPASDAPNGHIIA